MSIRELCASGIEALELASTLLQRARLADPQAGIWEAADMQWWWRTRRMSDDVEKLFWLDDDGPVAGVLLTSWSDDDWQCDPVLVTGASDLDSEIVWHRAIDHMASCCPAGFELPVRDDDHVFRELARQAGCTAGQRDSTAIMDATQTPAALRLPHGFVMNHRSGRSHELHHMRQRSGEHVATRLEQCSLYDPGLDFAVETDDGRLAGYSLYWFDPVTNVGLIEPVRVEDEFQRLGIARAMLTVGIQRLVQAGAERIKVSWTNDAAANLYKSVGFHLSSTTTWHRWHPR